MPTNHFSHTSRSLRRQLRKALRSICTILFILTAATTSSAGTNAAFPFSQNEDWPQWLGPNRNGMSSETGILKTWPADGPRVLWRAALGEGYSAISIANGRAYTLFSDDASEFAVCFDAESGAKIWQVRIDRKFLNSWGNGPRMAPTVANGTVFVISAHAKLYALHVQSGEILWQHDLAGRFGGTRPDLGYSNSPLAFENLLLVTVGGHNGQALVALDQKTGERVWASHSDHTGYSSPITIDAAGVQQAVFFTGTQALAVAPATGEIYWTYPWRTDSFENVSTPVFIPGDRIFLSSPHPKDKGSAVLQIRHSGNGLAVSPLWKNNAMKNHFSTSIYKDSYIYGTDRAILKCIDARSGEMMWQQRGFGEGTLIYADGHLIVLGTYGKLGLVEATHTGYREKASAQILSGKCYTVPSLANGRLYLRNQREIVCLDFREK